MHLAGALLAARSAGTFALSASLAALAAVSNRWSRGRRRPETSLGNRHPTGPPGKFSWARVDGCRLSKRLKWTLCIEGRRPGCQTSAQSRKRWDIGYGHQTSRVAATPRIKIELPSAFFLNRPGTAPPALGSLVPTHNPGLPPLGSRLAIGPPGLALT